MGVYPNVNFLFLTYLLTLNANYRMEMFSISISPFTPNPSIKRSRDFSNLVPMLTVTTLDYGLVFTTFMYFAIALITDSMY